MCANIHDIKESDELFVQMLQAMRDIDNAGVDENNFNEVTSAWWSLIIACPSKKSKVS